MGRSSARCGGFLHAPNALLIPVEDEVTGRASCPATRAVDLRWPRGGARGRGGPARGGRQERARRRHGSVEVRRAASRGGGVLPRGVQGRGQGGVIPLGRMSGGCVNCDHGDHVRGRRRGGDGVDGCSRAGGGVPSRDVRRGWVYVVVLETRFGGRTVGKLGAGLRVVRLQGPLDPLWSSVRYVAKVLQLIFGRGLLLGVVVFDERRRALHDRLAGTLVIEDRESLSIRP